jgi:hypothetical protein
MPSIEEDALLAAVAVELTGMLIDAEPTAMFTLIIEDEPISILVEFEAVMLNREWRDEAEDIVRDGRRRRKRETEG